MFVRCEDCNYENLAQHSFCGMCGAKLPSPQRVARSIATEPEPLPPPPAFEPERAAPQPATSRPSLLGLEAGPTGREQVHYLLEEEPGSRRWRGWVAVLILAAAMGGSGWHWRTEIRGWTGRAPQNPSAEANPDTNSALPTTAAPETATSSATTTAPTAVPAQAEGVAASAPAAATAAPTTQTATAPVQAVTDAVARAPEAKDEKASDSANQAVMQPATPDVPQPVKPKIERKAPATNESTDALETQGENYLYGHGVQADCGRAGKSLLTAAARSSARAQSVLGTMYATGHCVTRDVPTAYRWFAKALHQDPGNIRIQRDLEVLWAQMTEEERKVAMQTGP
ncbi:MAG: hypothetical protein ACLPOO_12115 [Terriglobales bacterium]